LLVNPERISKIVFAGIYTALIVGLGFALAAVPNIELVTVLIFFAGALMGFSWGVAVALLGEGLFSVLNPIGSGLVFPPLLIAQLLAMGLVAIAGAIVGRWPGAVTEQWFSRLILGITGSLLTLIYDMLTSAAFPLVSGFNRAETIAAIVGGIAFSVVHIISNGLIFALFVPVFFRIFRQANLTFRLRT